MGRVEVKNNPGTQALNWSMVCSLKRSDNTD